MHFDDKTKACRLSDDVLYSVSGGTSLQNERGEEIKEGRFITSTLSNYSSGEFPKYSAGELVKIKWRIGTDAEILCNSEVVSVSEDRNGGLLFRKFTYSVRILSCPNSDMIGLIEANVHENCLYL